MSTAVGALIAVVVAVLTQLWIGRRNSKEARVKRLEDALQDLYKATESADLTDEDDGLTRESQLRLALAGRFAQAWAKRCGYVGLAATLEASVKPLRIVKGKPGRLVRPQAAAALTKVVGVCSNWVEDPGAFEPGRRNEPARLTLESTSV